MAKYVLVTGGELKNKGAQAMTFAVANEMAKRFPEAEVIVFSNLDCNRSEEEKSQYSFRILPALSRLPSYSLITGLMKKFCFRKIKGASFELYREIYTNAIMQIDISGYALGSNWNERWVEAYLRRIRLAKWFHIPVYLMPQSFGPFDFEHASINRKIKKQLRRVDLIMAREEEGKALLIKKYRLDNVIKTMDLVLQSEHLNTAHIFKSEYRPYTVDVLPGSVAIIPNAKNNKYGSEEELMSLYNNLISMLRAKGKNVYFIYHAMEDLAICKKIKERYYANDSGVIVIEQEINCIDYQNLVASFEFIVASRYHSVVHSYKAHTPAIVLGWAVKYQSLTTAFEQEQFCFDVRDAIKFENIKDKVDYMLEHYAEESQRILLHLTEIQKKNVFDYLKAKQED